MSLFIILSGVMFLILSGLTVYCTPHYNRAVCAGDSTAIARHRSVSKTALILTAWPVLWMAASVIFIR